MGGAACVVGPWPSAGAAAPRVKPPANVAPLFRSSRRLKRFEPIGLSFADEPKRKSRSRSREYTPVPGPTAAGRPARIFDDPFDGRAGDAECIGSGAVECVSPDDSRPI